MRRKELDALKQAIAARTEKATDLDVLVEALLALPPGQLKNLLTEDILAVLAKYGYVEGRSMDDGVIVGLLSLAGTLAGSMSGILVSNRLVNFRLEQLEAKVQKHNNLVERTYQLEGQMQECQHEIADIKHGLGGIAK